MGLPSEEGGGCSFRLAVRFGAGWCGAGSSRLCILCAGREVSVMLVALRVR